MSGAHEGCSQGKSVGDRVGSKHSTAATLERVEGEAAVLPQDFEDKVHARQLAGVGVGVVQKSGEKDRYIPKPFLKRQTHAGKQGLLP